MKAATVEEAVKEAPATTRHPSVDETTAKKAVDKLGKDEEEAAEEKLKHNLAGNESLAPPTKVLECSGSEKFNSIQKSSKQDPNVTSAGLPPMETPDVVATPAETLRTKTPKTASIRKT